ncbi:class I SAM-dependent methyltransferase [Rhodobacteraceae bacterium CCMM004]|nr:class I SAM-dependent methyltransferase [Rhodobacteraceae bacterium CCMM004]
MDQSTVKGVCELIFDSIEAGSVLVVGSAATDLLVELSRSDVRLTGIDRDVETLAQARVALKRGTDDSVLRLYSKAEARAALESETFDAIVVTDPATLPDGGDRLKPLWRCLHADGALLWVTPFGQKGEPPSYLMGPMKQVHTLFKPQAFSPSGDTVILNCERRSAATTGPVRVDADLVDQLEAAFAEVERDLRQAASAAAGRGKEGQDVPGAPLEQTVRHANILLEGYLLATDQEDHATDQDGAPDQLMARVKLLLRELNRARSVAARVQAAGPSADGAAVASVPETAEEVSHRQAGLDAQQEATDAALKDARAARNRAGADRRKKPGSTIPCKPSSRP